MLCFHWYHPYLGVTVEMFPFFLVEVLVFAGNLGQCAALPTGVLLEKFGPRMALIASTVIVVPPYLLLWHAQHVAELYHDNVGIVAFYTFLIGTEVKKSYTRGTLYNNAFTNTFEQHCVDI